MTKKNVRHKILKEAAVPYIVEPQAEIPGVFSTTITSKGQVVIPASLRRRYGIEPQTRIMIYDDGQAIRLKPVTHQTIDRLCGVLQGHNLTKVLMEERAADREREDARRLRS
ncbi:MAG: AbrB/MazE/SpoVT family DNA-binding domain-containing protein [Chloroflexi bacterium]|nr:AbrB/MazE/SpoVT family DNA-binding domain-containing protein [Chloroflexota bacterium]MBI5349466.1 AbrB/MazE/SpoVT family DNA-binding domain-containing protein [Chloroflexota bacterium]MBI5715492.1 AbrB/MazE/SpoVT family DNA-binding domain-containing protein [Chloroflexota bacterium]